MTKIKRYSEDNLPVDMAEAQAARILCREKMQACDKELWLIRNQYTKKQIKLNVEIANKKSAIIQEKFFFQHNIIVLKKMDQRKWRRKR